MSSMGDFLIQPGYLCPTSFGEPQLPGSEQTFLDPPWWLRKETDHHVWLVPFFSPAMFSDSESDDESLHRLTINEHYAKAFEYKKEREELEKCASYPYIFLTRAHVLENIQ
jgi:hypothetical protein